MLNKEFLLLLILFTTLLILFIFFVINVTSTTVDKSAKKIPKMIYQTYPGKKGDPIPENVKKNIHEIKNNNPEWGYKLFRDDEIEEFIDNFYGNEYLSIFKKINDDYGAAKADFFRYLLMYKKGGVYLDIKSGLSKPLNDIVKPNDKYIISYWEDKLWKNMYNYPNGEIQQWYIICVSGHNYLKETIDNVIDNILNYHRKKLGVGGIGTLQTTGPIVYTKSIIPILRNNNHTMYENEVPGLIFKKIKNHHTLFKKKHYSKLTTPIVN
jgi:hypothetical protein